MSLKTLFKPKKNISDADLKRSMNWLVAEGIGWQVMESIAVGTILVGYALSLGASNVVIGLLASLPFLGNLTQLPMAYLVEKFRKRKLLTIIAHLLSRPFMLAVAFVAFKKGDPSAPMILFAVYALRYIFGGAGGASWNPWMQDLIPRDRLGRFFARRLRLTMLSAVVISLLSAVVVDLARRFFPDYAIYAYTLLFSIAFVAGMFGTFALLRVDEPEMAKTEHAEPFFKMLRVPLKDVNFRKLIAFLGFWNFAFNLSSPFFSVYMIQMIGLDITTVSALVILSQVINMAVMPIWGSIADKFAYKPILLISIGLYIACLFGWTFTSWPTLRPYTIPMLILLHILIGVVNAGITLSVANIALKLAPKGKGASYLTTNTLIASICAGIAPICGGLFSDFFTSKELSIKIHWESETSNIDFETFHIEYWGFFMFFAAIVAAFSLYFLRRVQEEGSVKENIVWQEFKGRAFKSVGNLSQSIGLKSVFLFTYGLVKRNKKPIKDVPEIEREQV